MATDIEVLYRVLKQYLTDAAANSSALPDTVNRNRSLRDLFGDVDTSSKAYLNLVDDDATLFETIIGPGDQYEDEFGQRAVIEFIVRERDDDTRDRVFAQGVADIASALRGAREHPLLTTLDIFPPERANLSTGPLPGVKAIRITVEVLMTAPDMLGNRLDERVTATIEPIIMSSEVIRDRDSGLFGVLDPIVSLSAVVTLLEAQLASGIDTIESASAAEVRLSAESAPGLADILGSGDADLVVGLTGGGIIGEVQGTGTAEVPDAGTGGNLVIDPILGSGDAEADIVAAMGGLLEAVLGSGAVFTVPGADFVASLDPILGVGAAELLVSGDAPGALDPIVGSAGVSIPMNAALGGAIEAFTSLGLAGQPQSVVFGSGVISDILSAGDAAIAAQADASPSLEPLLGSGDVALQVAADSAGVLAPIVSSSGAVSSISANSPGLIGDFLGSGAGDVLIEGDGAGLIDAIGGSGTIQPEATGYDVILIAGQSNTHFGFQLDPGLDGAEADIFELGNRAPNIGVVIPAADPLDFATFQPDSIGFGLSFAKRYKAEGELAAGRQILLVAAGVGDTGFLDNDWNPGNAVYNDAITRANQAIAELAGSRLAAILWHQGENDVLAAASETAYKTALDTMIASMRADIAGDNSTVPFVLGGMVPFWVDNTAGAPALDGWIQDTPNRVNYTGFASARSPTVISKPDDNEDIAHFNAAGQRELGTNRYWTAYLAAKGNELPVSATAAGQIGVILGSGGATAPITLGGAGLVGGILGSGAIGSGLGVTGAGQVDPILGTGDATVASAANEPETDAYVARMTVAPDATRIGHINDLIAGLKADGVWTKLDALWLFAAHDAQTSLLNVKSASFNATDVNTASFVADQGYTGSAPGEGVWGITTGYNNATDHAASNGHIGLWYDQNAFSDGFVIGYAAFFGVFINFSGQQAFYGAGETAVTSSAITDDIIHLIHQGQNPGNVELWSNAVDISNASSVLTPEPYGAGPVEFLGENSNGLARAAHVGDYLTATDIANLNTRLSTYLAAI